MSNAFPSPCHNALDAAVYTLAYRDDIEILLQRHREAITHIVASDKAVDIRSGSGAMQGDGPAGPLFLEVYHPQVDTWLGVVQLLPQQRLCCAQDPVSQVYVDCSLTAYADDLGKTTVVTNKQDALDKIRSINNSLDTALASIGMAQNGIKQENVVHATGRHSGSFLRDMYTQGVGIGKTVAIAKYLGARRSYNNLFHDEIQERIRAAFSGYASMGSFWSRARNSRKAVRLLFRGMVQETLLSGLEATVLRSVDIRKLDRALLQLGRKVLQGVACEKQTVVDQDGFSSIKYQAKPNEFVWKQLQMAPCDIELRIKRLTFWQQVARAPDLQVSLLASVFGEIEFDSPMLCLDSGKPTNAAHAWILRLCEDIEALRQSDVVAHIPERMAGKPLSLFMPPLWEDFVHVDCSIVRKAFLSVAIPPPGYVEAAAPSPVQPPAEIPEREHVCTDLLPDGSICRASFSSFRALQVHRRGAKDHNFVAPEYHLAFTNQCPWCHIVYNSLQQTRHHIKQSLHQRRCRGKGSIVPVPILPVDSLVCSKCTHECSSLSDLQKNMCAHYGGPDFTADWT